MVNVKHEVKGNKLVITVDLDQDYGYSGSGKNKVVATTRGNAEVGDDRGTKFGLNVFRKP